MDSDLYIITCVCENAITVQTIARKASVSSEVTRLLRSYVEGQLNTDLLADLDRGVSAELDGYDAWIDDGFDEQGHFSAHCSIDEDFDIYARPMPELTDV